MSATAPARPDDPPGAAAAGDPVGPATLPVAEVVAVLPVGDIEPLRACLAGLGVDVAAVRGLPQWNSPAGTAAVPRPRGAAAGTGALPDGDGLEAVLARALTVAAPVPAGAALLGLYVWRECAITWGLSYQFGRIWETLRGFVRLWPAYRQLVPDPAEAAAAEAVLCGLRLLDREIVVENEQTCGAPARQAAAVRSALRRAEQLAAAAGRIRASHPEIAGYLAGQADARQRHYRALAPAIEATVQVLAGRPQAGQAGIDALRAAEADRDLLVENYRSMLRAYRFSLEELVASAGQDWLTIEHAKLLYLYPFGLRGVPAAEAVARVRAGGERWELAGITPAEVRPALDLDDVWRGADFLGRRFEGAAIVLPELAMTDMDGESLGSLRGELRFSDLGNHYLRLEAQLDQAGPQELRFAMFRAAPEHGTIRLVCRRSGAEWPRLSDLAEALVRALPARLARAGEQVAAHVRPGMYHVLVSVHEASVGTGPAAPAELRRPVRDARQLTGAVGGAALLHPVPNAVGAIAEWVRSPATAVTVLDGVGLTGDLVARTENTTVMVMLGTPSFQIGMYRTLAEFAGSLGGLFGAWFDELAAYHTRVMKLLDRLGDGGGELSELTADAEELRREQLRLHDFVAEARSVQSLIRSPALVASPQDAAELRRLLDVAGWDRVAGDFATKVAELLDDRLGTHLEALAARRQEEADRIAARHERRSNARMNTLLAVIAGAGVAGVVQVLQAELEFGAAGSILGAAVVVLIAVVAGVAVRALFAEPRQHR